MLVSVFGWDIAVDAAVAVALVEMAARRGDLDGGGIDVEVCPGTIGVRENMSVGAQLVELVCSRGVVSDGG